MTPMLTSEAFAALGAPNLVYVKPLAAREILEAAPEGATFDVQLEPDQILYALHRADGERLAVLIDRDSAVAAAFANHLAPVSVH